MRKLIIMGALFLALLSFAANDLRAEWDVHRYSGLNSDTQSKLKQLKENGDLPGIMALWETTADPQNEGSINNAFQDALVSFPRETFIPVLEEGMKSRKRLVADWCISTLLRFHSQKALDFYLNSISLQHLTADEERHANELIDQMKSGDKTKRQDAANGLVDMGRGIIRIVYPLTKGPDEKLARVAQSVINRVRFLGLRYDLITRVGVGQRWEIWGGMLPVGNSDQIISVLRGILKDEPYNYDGVQLAIAMLVKWKKTDDAELIRSYLHGDNDIYAISAVGQLKDVKSVPVLLEILAEGHKRCSYGAEGLKLCYVAEVARALGEMGDKSAIEPLEKELDAESQLTDKADEQHIENSRNDIIAALARCGEKKYLYAMIDKTNPDKFPVEMCGPDEKGVVLEYLPNVKDPDVVFRMVCWLGCYVPEPDEKVMTTLKEVRKGLPSPRHAPFMADPFDAISSYLSYHGDAEGKENALQQMKSDAPSTRAHAISMLYRLKDKESLLPLFIEACDDKGEYIPPLSGTGFKDEVRETAIMAVTAISGEPFDLWHFDRDRQVKEIKAWYAKYTGQNVAEEKQGGTDNSGGFLMKKIYIALLAIFLCGAAIVVYVYFAGADKRAVAKTMENVRVGVKNSDSNLVLAQVSKDYNYDGYSYAALQVAVPAAFLHMKPSEVTFSNMEITGDGKKAHVKFHFSVKHSVKEVMGVTIEAEIVTAGDAEVNLVKEADGWKIIEATARDTSGEKITLRF